jgi:hypothetical protein
MTEPPTERRGPKPIPRKRSFLLLLPPKLSDALERFAAENEVTQTEVLRRALSEYLQKQTR